MGDREAGRRRVVEGVVVEPQAPGPAFKTYYHPLSGLIILGLDWLAFGLDFFSDFVALPLVCAAVFALTFVAVQAVQQRLRGDPPAVARRKALWGAVAAGLPFPITGTLLGTAILALSGLSGRKPTPS